MCCPCSHTCSCCKCREGMQGFSLSGDIVKTKADITYNTNRLYPNGKKAPNGIEIRFGSARPTEQVRDMLKAGGFKFSEKQTIWYAIDNAKSRELAEFLTENEVDVDTTQYEKRFFPVRVNSMEQYKKLREHTEFYVKSTPPKTFYRKSYLEKTGSVPALISEGILSYKKFYNKVVGEDEDQGANEDKEEEKEEQQEGNKASSPSPKTDDHTAIADKLQALAQGMQKQIDAKLNSATSRQRPTAKRLRVASGMRQDGYRLQDIQRLLYALSEAHRNGKIKEYPILGKIRSRSQVELFLQYRRAQSEKWGNETIKRIFDREKADLAKIGITSVFNWDNEDNKAQVLEHALSPASLREQQQKQEKIKELERQIFSQKIPGFFPTPQDLIERLIVLAGIREGNNILEPSAGKGDILDALRETFGDSVSLYACEVYSSLKDILQHKGYNVVHGNFLEYEGLYDRIIMNPPFENGQDMEHVNHAFNSLRKGGRLVAIMSEGVFFREFKKEKAFREFLTRQNAYISEPIKEGFKDGFKSTGVNVRIVAINKDGSPIDIRRTTSKEDPEKTEDSQSNLPTDSEVEILELEAQAEIEFLKLQLELAKAKKRKGLDGFGGVHETDQQKRQRLIQWARELKGIPDVWDFK